MLALFFAFYGLKVGRKNDCWKSNFYDGALSVLS